MSKDSVLLAKQFFGRPNANFNFVKAATQPSSVRTSKARDASSEVMAVYVSCMDDVCCSQIDRMYEIYSKSALFAKDGKFRESLTKLKELSDKRYNFITSVMSNVELSCELKDGAQDYMDGVVTDIRRGFQFLSKGSGAIRYKLSAEIMTTFILVQASIMHASKCIDDINDIFRVTVKGYGNYLMTEELEILNSMCDKYVKTFPDSLKPVMDSTANKAVSNFHPKVLLVKAARYAKNYIDNNSSGWREFCSSCKNIYNINIK